jgi:hypothetical protein
MFRKLNSNKRKMGESSGATEQSSRTDLPCEGVVGDTPSSVAPPVAPPVSQSMVPPSPVAASSPPLATGLPPLTPSRLSAGDSLLSSLSRDPMAVSFNLARQSLEFMHKHDSMKGMPSEDLGANLRTAMLDISKVSIHCASLFVLV